MRRTMNATSLLRSSSAKSASQSVHRLAQRGLSLLELMVGITIGLLVTLAALGTVHMTKTASIAVSDSARLEQQTNMVLNLIAEQVRQAGAMNLTTFSSTASPATAEENSPALVMFDMDFAALNGASSSTRKVIVEGKSISENFDSITFTYSQPVAGTATGSYQGMAQNCAGEGAIQYPLESSSPATQSPQVVSTLYAQQSNTDTTPNLYCATPGQVPQPLASNVAEFKVRYLRNNGNTARTLTAEQVSASSEGWAGIDGLEICLHLTGEATKAAPAAPNAAVKNCAGKTIANDGKLHRVARNVFQLRNSASL